MSSFTTETARLIRAGRRAESRKKFIGSLVTAAVSAGAMMLTNGLMIMLAVSVAHKHWIHTLPTIGYWPACILALLLKGVFSSTRKDRS
jgi:hypothetical protein